MKLCRFMLLIAAASLLPAAHAVAQEQAEQAEQAEQTKPGDDASLKDVIRQRSRERTAESEEEAKPDGDPSLRDLLRERIRRTAKIPEAADEAREAGIPENEVEEIIRESRRRRLPPEEVEEVLVESAASARENGPVDNFGAFVQSQLDRGLRGRELAAAIHEEHARRGKGPLKDKARDQGQGKGKGKGKGKGNR